jgi:hypothetical protein
MLTSTTISILARFRALLKTNGVTIEIAAKHAGKSRQWLTIALSKGNIQLNDLVIICEKSGIDLREVLTGQKFLPAEIAALVREEIAKYEAHK